MSATTPPVGPIALRPAGPEDEPFLLRVYASTREDEMRLTGWDEAQKAAFLRMQFTLQARHYREHYPGPGYQVIMAGGRAVGRIFVDRGAAEIRVVDIAMLPESRDRGIGGALLRNVLAESEATGTPVRLHVEPFNPAVRLYRRLGFTPVGEPGVYQEMERLPSGRAP